MQKLKHLGLAEEVTPGRWRLAEGIEDTLRRMGERGDIIKTMHREMTGKGVARAASDYVIYDPAGAQARPIVGRLIARGLSDEINDRHYLIVDAVDGRSHYVEISKGEATEPTPEGGIVRIDPKRPEPRQVDREVDWPREGRDRVVPANENDWQCPYCFWLVRAFRSGARFVNELSRGVVPAAQMTLKAPPRFVGEVDQQSADGDFDGFVLLRQVLTLVEIVLVDDRPAEQALGTEDEVERMLLPPTSKAWLARST